MGGRERERGGGGEGTRERGEGRMEGTRERGGRRERGGGLLKFPLDSPFGVPSRHLSASESEIIHHGDRRKENFHVFFNTIIIYCIA